MTLFCKDWLLQQHNVCFIIRPWRLCSIWNLQVGDFRSEWPGRKLGHLERLEAERDADDGDA